MERLQWYVILENATYYSQSYLSEFENNTDIKENYTTENATCNQKTKAWKRNGKLENEEIWKEIKAAVKQRKHEN